MSLCLTATDRRHVAAAHEVMLSPLEHGDRDAWMLAVNDRLRDLVGADHTIAFFLDENGFDYVSNDTDTRPLRPLEDMVIGWNDAGFARFAPTEDGAARYFERFHRMRRGGGSGAYHEMQADIAQDMKRTDHWQTMFYSTGARFMTGLSTPLPMGEATIEAPASQAAEGSPPARRSARIRWAQLLARIYEVLPPDGHPFPRVRRQGIEPRTY